MLNWNSLTSIEQLTAIEKQSFNRPQIIFKHSTRCPISQMALNRMLREEAELIKIADLHYLDLISHRETSQEVAVRYQITHESPQIIILSYGKPIYHASHHMILPHQIIDYLKKE